MNDGNLTSAVILVVAGYLLLTLEVFLPTGGILGALSLAAICIGVTLGFKSSLMAGSLVLAGTVAGVPLLLKALTWLWPKTAMGKKMTVESEAGEGTVGSLPGNIALEQLVGAFGIVTSELRPAGSIDFSGKKVDGISEGILVPAGQRVLCIGTQSGYVVVRPADSPDLNDLENARLPGFDLENFKS